MTVQHYVQDLQRCLRDLCDRMHSGRYRAQPVRRVYVAKADGGGARSECRPWKTKSPKGAVAEVLSAVYEADFLDCSCGFLPGRSAHQALRTVHGAVMSERVNWVLDADIRKFFDSMDHEWMMWMLAHRIADPRVLRLVRQWLGAGVMEHGNYAHTDEGTPQGAGISPLLANLFLHYALDLWVRQCQRRHATGRMRLVRYADDFVPTFESRGDAHRMQAALGTRLAKFGLALHADKTRLIEFGGRAAERHPVPHRSPAGLAVRADAPEQPQPNVLVPVQRAAAPVPPRPGENRPCLALPLKHIGSPTRGAGCGKAARPDP